MMLQPLDDPLGITGHRCGRRVIQVREKGIKYRAGTLHQPLNMLVDLAVNVGNQEKLLVSLDHEPGEMHGTELILRPGKIWHQRGQLVRQRLGVGWTLNREVKDHVTLAHTVLLLGIRLWW